MKTLGEWLHQNWIAFKFYLVGHFAGFFFHHYLKRPKPFKDLQDR